MRRAMALFCAAVLIVLCLAIMIDSTASMAEQAPAEPVHITYTGLIFEPKQEDAETEYQQRLLDEAYAVNDTRSFADAQDDSVLCHSEERRDEESARSMFDGWIEDCTVTYYCCERYPHICGGGTGITALGREVEAGVSVAVDPAKIPLGSRVFVDYGDGIVHEYRADDTGNAVLGDHIDIAVQTHDEALMLGLRTATVWWCEA